MTRRRASSASEPAQDARTLLAAVVESSDDAIITTTLDGTITSWNASAGRLFGYTAAEIIGQPLSVLIPPDRRDEERHITENLRRGNRIEHYETVRVRKDGQLIDVSLTVSPLRDQTGQIVGASKILRDITAAKAAEEALRAAHDAFRNLVDHSPFGVYAVNADFQIVQVSAGARRAFANVDPVIGRDLGEALRILWPESFANEAISRFRHTLESGEPYHAPSTVERRRDIEEIEAYDWKIERMTLPDGRPGVVCHFYDLSERQRLEAALRESEERLRIASDAAGAFVYDVDLSAHRKIIVRGLERVTGYRPDEVELTNDWWVSLIHPDDRPAHLENVARHTATGEPYSASYRVRRNDGAWIWVAATAQIFKDAGGFPVQIVGTLVDITERRKAEEALRASEQKFRRLHGVSSRLLAASDLTSALGDVLENAIASCGAVYGNIQLLNSRTRALEIVAHRGFKQDFLAHFREVQVEEGSACAQALQSGERMIIEDVELDPSFAPHRPIAAAAGYRAVQLTPLKAHDGRVVGMLSTHFRAPHRVPESDQQQLDLYARHAADLIVRVQYEQALRDGERRKDEFLATLAHELRNPLAPIRHGLEILKRDRSDPNRAARVLPVMERQVSHMVRLIDDLLDVGRIASNKLELKKERVDLASIVREVVDACRPLIENAGHELSVMLPSEPINLRADPVRLSQVLGNLITNSCKYTEPGGRIWLTVERQASEAAVSVRDNGAGIPTDQLPNVFNLFMQVDRTLERSNGGLGLGLPLVKRLVEMHGGSVTAHSEGLGRGSEFIVRLPVLIDDQVEARPPPQSDLAVCP